MLRLIRSYGLPEPVLQFEVRAGAESFHVDMAYPNVRLAIELDGYEWHSRRDRWQMDRDRDNLLATIGWRVVRVSWERLTRSPNETAALVAEMLTS